MNRRRRVLVPMISTLHFVQHVFRILPPILPLLAVAFGYPLWQLGALVSVYYAGSGMGQAPAGILVDRHDKRELLPPAVALMGVGYLVFPLAASLSETTPVMNVAGTQFSAAFLLMVIGSFTSGTGASFIHPAGYPLASANADADAEGMAFGIWGGSAKLGDAAAPTAVALLVLLISWNEVFLLFGVLGVLYAIVLYLLLSREWVETQPGRRQVEPTSQSDPVEASDDRRRYTYPMFALVVFFVARAFSEKGLKAFLPLFIVGVYGYTLEVAGLRLPLNRSPTYTSRSYSSSLRRYSS